MYLIRNKYVLVLLVLLSCILFIIGLYAFRGFIRITMIPSIYSSVRKPQIEKTVENETRSIAPALHMLGVSNIRKEGTSECFTASVSKLNIQVDCVSSGREGTGTLKGNEMASYAQKAQQAEGLLVDNGWPELSFNEKELQYKPNASEEENTTQRFGYVIKRPNKGTLCYMNIDLVFQADSINPKVTIRCEYGKG